MGSTPDPSRPLPEYQTGPPTPAPYAATGPGSGPPGTMPDVSSKRIAIWVTVTVLLLGQGAAAAFIVWSKPTAQQAGPASPNELLRRARVLAEDGDRLQALALIEQVQTKGNPSLEARVQELQRSILATPKLLQAKRMIERGEWEPARYHLEQVLRLVPAHAEALALMAEARRHRADAAPSKAPPAPDAAVAAAVATVDDPAKKPRRPDRRPGERAPRPKKPAAAAVPQTGALFVISKPRAMLYIDGTLRGSTPQDGIALSPGPHRVEIKLSGMQTHQATVQVRAGESHALNVALKPERKAAPQPTPTPVAKPTPTPEPAAPRTIPKLALPQKVRVPLFKDGQPAKVVRVVCIATERTVTKAMGRSAAGATRQLLSHLYANAKPADAPMVTLYPRTMGYLIAQALNRNDRGIGASLVHYHKSGRMESLAAANWRP